MTTLTADKAKYYAELHTVAASEVGRLKFAHAFEREEAGKNIILRMMKINAEIANACLLVLTRNMSEEQGEAIVYNLIGEEKNLKTLLAQPCKQKP